MISIYYLTVVLATYVCVVNGQLMGNTTSGGNCECIPLYNCEPLLKLVQNPRRTPQESQLLENSKCGQSTFTSLVCCPAECTTPEGNVGKCVDIYSCPHLANRLRTPVSQATIMYFRKTICNGSTPHSVCCGPAPLPAAITPPSTTTTLPPITSNPGKILINMNERCSAQRSSVPPDPSTHCCGYESTVVTRIIGGNATTISMYPWLGIIEYERINPGNIFLCGGTLISARYFLTAAHCIAGFMITNIGTPKVVRLGEHDTDNPGKDCMIADGGGNYCTNGEVRINIETLIPHPEFNLRIPKDDIGLIKLVSMAPFTDFIRPICLPTSESDITLNPPPPEQFTLYTAGWGATEYAKFSNVKRHIDLPYVGPQECQEAYRRSYIRINMDGKMCAGGIAGKDSCKGDSGGPLMYQNGLMHEVLGVVNAGLGCGLDGIPGLYAKVFSYREWINTTIQNNL
ncbi:hypothetical protein K1T71_012470 [Dendrolimus kikuchii]|uniref:Uncharacterized protein n=1 Tax=Dendrolimus kikuchii TaxID=765133 RepID=A0ACC1CJF0_9NEOP|nr:hypothetical protein K1T71_012470 [Dendrolimus kikuchii]